MTPQPSIDMLICGAGAAGLTLAIELARRGVTFRLIEQRAEPFPGSRGKGIQPRSQEIFEDLGVIDRLVAAGGVYPPSRRYREGGGYDEEQVMDLSAPTPEEPYQIPLLVPQFLTETVLRERLAELGHRPHWGCGLKGFEQEARGVTARVAGPAGEEVLRVRYLVGTDGGRSFVRHALHLDFAGKTLGVRALVADVMLEGVTAEAWHRWNDGGPEMIMLCPLRGTPLFQLQGPVALEGDVDLSAEGLTALLAARTGRQDLIIRSVSWASVFHMNARLAEHYRVGRVFLAGDAAHIHPPTGGQGLNTSVQDAYNLGWKLAAVLEGAPDSLLDTYEEERRPIAAQMLGLSTRLLKATQEGGTLRRGREVHQLDLSYVDSSLSLRSGSRTQGLQAGERAPDAPVRGSAGLPTRLFKLFQGPHWTLLGHETAHGSAPAARPHLHIHTFGPRGDLVDDQGHFQKAYGVAPGDWVLVRPDGYVGAVVPQEALATLNDYLERVGLRSEWLERRVA